MPERLIRAFLLIAGLFLAAIGIIVGDVVPDPYIETPPIERIFATTASSTNVVLSSNATVVRTVDGDTLVARLDSEGGEWTVRLLGVDTPETVDPRKPVQCMGKEASAALADLLPEGHRIRLESDPKADERDTYGRLLRNAVLEDGTDVNATLINSGLALALLRFPLSPERKVQLHALEEGAKNAGRGLWAPEVCRNK